MGSDEYEESEKNVDDDVFRFLELLLVSSRYEHEPTSIDDEDDTEDGQEGIEEIDDFSYYGNGTREILVSDLTASYRDPCA